MLGDQWFQLKKWIPHRFQQETWAAVVAGKSGLLNAPTGYGKTYALWFGILERLLAKRDRSSKNAKQRTFCLWITPLRSLSQEMVLALNRVNEDLHLQLDIALRTGDTPLKERQRQLLAHPDVLITTPESIHLMLAQKGYPERLKHLQVIVVDEWHELLGSKRGVLTELALSRLKHLNKHLQIWGISATIGNLEEAKEILLGHKSGVIIKANLPKKTEITTVLPDILEKFPWGGHLGIHLAAKVLPIINQSKTTLIFTNTRSQAEIWYQELLKLQPDLAGILALHHGSLSEEIRQWVEAALHNGTLKAVVCTSSLDLGVDFRPVDTVIQIGSAKGIARFLQRAGRSGHQPGATSKIWFVPTHSLEIIEGAALRYAEQHQLMENRIPYIRSFDVLIQYLITLAVSEGFVPDEIFNEVKSTHCFASITPEEFHQCLLLITQGGKTLDAYDEFHKVVIEDGLYKVTSKKIAMRHRLSIGAIVSDTMMRVKYASGKYIGSIEEWFISRLNVGDTFWFAGKNLELLRVKDLQAIVKLSTKKKGLVPSWMGGRLPLSTHLAFAIRHILDQWQGTASHEPEVVFLTPLFEEQEQRSTLPNSKQLVIEQTQTKDGYHVFFFPFEGKFVHEGMAALIAHRLAKTRAYTFSVALNDYGFELLSDQPIDMQEAIQHGLFTMDNLSEDIQQSINMTELARKRFRDIAGIAGLVFQGFPGKKIKTKHLQANAGLFFKVFEEYENDNLLLKEAYDEVFDFQLDYARLRAAFKRITENKIMIRHPLHLTPFAFPIFAESFRERFSNEALEDRLSKMIAQIE